MKRRLSIIALSCLIAVFVRDAFTDEVQRRTAAESLIQEYRPRIHQHLEIELAFVNDVCSLSEKQAKQLAVLCEKLITGELQDRAFAATEKRNRFAGIQLRSMFNVPSIINVGIDKAVRTTLSEEQLRRYQTEMAKRSEFRKQATIQMIAANLDKRLELSIPQREQIMQSLSSDWREAWERSMERLMHSDGLVPAIQAKHILPVLNDEQERVWYALKKQNPVKSGSGRF